MPSSNLSPSPSPSPNPSPSPSPKFNLKLTPTPTPTPTLSLTLALPLTQVLPDRALRESNGDNYPNGASYDELWGPANGDRPNPNP